MILTSTSADLHSLPVNLSVKSLLFFPLCLFLEVPWVLWLQKEEKRGKDESIWQEER